MEHPFDRFEEWLDEGLGDWPGNSYDLLDHAVRQEHTAMIRRAGASLIEGFLKVRLIDSFSEVAAR